MIQVFNCTEEKDHSGRPKKMYVVTGVKTRSDALNEVARYKKKSLANIQLTHSARIAIIVDNELQELWWMNDASPEIKERGQKCWAIRLRDEIHE